MACKFSPLTSLILAAAFAFTAAWSARTAVTLQTSRDPLIATPQNVSLGVVKQGEVRRVPITLKNASQSVVIVDEVVSNCGCLLESLDNKLLQPGDSRRLILRWDVGLRRQQSLVNSIVKYRVQEPPFSPRILQLAISAYIEPQMVVEPVEVSIDQRSAGPSPEIIQVRRGEGWQKGALAGVAVSHGLIYAMIKENNPFTGAATIEVMPVSPLGDDEVLKLLDISVRLYFTDSIEEEYSVPVRLVSSSAKSK